MNKSIFVVTIFTLVICCTLGLPAAPNPRIVGGDKAVAGQFPYVVSITENDKHFCGGFIYGPKWIVTAASCVSGKLTSTLKVVVGQLSFTQLEPYEHPIGVYSIFIFDQYNSTNQQNDIALLQLISEISFDDDGDSTTPPAQGVPNFIKYNEVDPTKLTGTVMGWGTNTDGGAESINLRYGSMNIEETASCGNYGELDFNVGNMICTSTIAPTDTDPVDPEGAGSPCQYDQGSPLVQDTIVTIEDPNNPGETIDETVSIVVGVVSKFESCALGAKSVFTRVSVFYYWLIKIAGIQPA